MPHMTDKDKKEIKGYMRKLADNFGKVVKKISKDSQDRFDGYVEDVNDRFKATNEGMMGIHQKLDKIEKTLDSHSEQLANALVDLNGVKIDMGKVSYEVTMHMDRKIDKKHFVDLEGRVRVLEK